MASPQRDLSQALVQGCPPFSLPHRPNLLSLCHLSHSEVARWTAWLFVNGWPLSGCVLVTALSGLGVTAALSISSPVPETLRQERNPVLSVLLALNWGYLGVFLPVASH